MTEIEEQAAQMRTMVWLEMEQRANFIKDGGLPMCAWKHPDSKRPDGKADVCRHQAIPPEIVVYTDEGFDPGDRRSYALISSWWD